MNERTLCLPPACQALFDEADLPTPPLPSAQAAALRPLRPGVFATPGAPDLHALDDMAAHWAQRPGSAWAWVGFHDTGRASAAVRVCQADAQAGFFVQRHWSSQPHDSALRLEGAFELLARAQQLVAAAPAWPAGRRLALLDDDFDRERWGWLEPGAHALAGLLVDPLAYLGVLVALDQLGRSEAVEPVEP